MRITKAWKTSSSAPPLLSPYSVIIMLRKSVGANCGQAFREYCTKAINGPLHFGAIAGRSAVDAAATLIHTVLAFDMVLETRLIKRLWK